MKGGLRELALFAGAGGGLLGSQLLGWRTACAVEIDPYCRRVLLQRQADGHLDRFPVWDDVQTFDGNPWRGAVDVVSAGFPCQEVSAGAAGKASGLSGRRSGLVYEVLRIVGEIRPALVFAENSQRLRTNGLGAVLSSFAELGYDCAWGVLGAGHAGAPHQRDRLWLLAADSGSPLIRQQRKRTRGEGRAAHVSAPARQAWAAAWCDACGEAWCDGCSTHLALCACPGGENADVIDCAADREAQALDWWGNQPGVDCMADGVAARVDRLRALGNGQVPAVAAVAFRTLAATLGIQ